MKRRAILPAAILIASAGCFEGDFDNATIRNKRVETPEVTEASVAVAARVDLIGRSLVGKNPFLGVEPTFHTFGRQEPEIYHPDSNGVFVTEGLVGRCKTDEELSAMLALELAKMSAEQRAAGRLRKSEPLRTLPDSGTLSAGGVGPDQNQLGTQALFDQNLGRSGDAKKSAPPATDTRTAAVDILKSAGIDPKALDAVEPLMKDAAKNHALADQFGGRSFKPVWTY
jgi:hypothetical protein